MTFDKPIHYSKQRSAARKTAWNKLFRAFKNYNTLASAIFRLKKEMKKDEPKVNGVVVDAVILEHELNARIKKLRKLQEKVDKVQKELDLPGSAYPRLKLKDLHAGLPYSAIRKTIQSWAHFFSPQCQTTYRAVDPGLRDVITWVDFFQEEDIRQSARSIASKAYHGAIGSSGVTKKNVAIVKQPPW